MATALIKKSQDIQSQARERYAEELKEMFQRDISLFEEYVEKLNLYEALTVDDWEEDRPTIPIGQYLSKCRVMLDKGFAVEVSRRLLKLYDDTCLWTIEKLSPVLTEYARKLDTINEDLQTKVDAQEEELIQYRKLLEEVHDAMNSLKNVVLKTKDPIELKKKLVLEVFTLFDQEDIEQSLDEAEELDESSDDETINDGAESDDEVGDEDAEQEEEPIDRRRKGGRGRKPTFDKDFSASI